MSYFIDSWDAILNNYLMSVNILCGFIGCFYLM